MRGGALKLPLLASAAKATLARSIWTAVDATVAPAITKTLSTCSRQAPRWTGLLRPFSSLPSYTPLAMPALSPTMTQGNVVEWKVSVGQEVAPGDVLAEIETDKAVLSWENQDEGFVAKLLVAAGTQGIDVGSTVAILVEEEDQIAAFKDYQPEAGAGAAAALPVEAATPAAAAPAVEAVKADSRIGPAARRYLEESGIPISAVHPTGPHHMVLKGDVLAAIGNGGVPAAAAPSAPAAAPKLATQTAAALAAPAPAAAAPAAPKAAAPAPLPPVASGEAFTDIPTTQIRRIIAQRLWESKTTIPHYYLEAKVDLDGIAQMRAALKEQGIKVSVNDCVIKAAAIALAEVPAANAFWDSAAGAIVASPSVDISIAVATEGGLITPIVKNADTKSIQAIAAEVRELASRARANKLKPEEFQGGSFSISNLGMFGIDSFSAIINPPQACIMAVGGARSVARWGKDGAPVAATEMTVTLSADNRVYDGAVASGLLKAFAKAMNNPYRLLT